MLLNERVESTELTVLKLLNLRMEIPDDAKHRLSVLQKGYEGEVRFDDASAWLADKFLILRNLFLDHDGNKFQIDTLIITQKCIVVCEVKYYQGNYYYEDGEFRNITTR
ncbi:MAG: nuclease-related domain-containing protein, partial [Bacillus sp. (in: firmicutes)]